MRPTAKPGYQERSKYILKNFEFQSIFSGADSFPMENPIPESETGVLIFTYRTNHAALLAYRVATADVPNQGKFDDTALPTTGDPLRKAR